MLPIVPTISTWLSQGSLANQVNGTSSSNLTGSTASQSSITPTNGVQLGSAFENMISQLSSTNSVNGAGTTAATSSGAQAVHGHHGHGHGGGGGSGGVNALIQALEELEDSGSSVSTTPVSSSSAISTTAGSSATTPLSSAATTQSGSTTSVSNIEATLNQLLQNLKLGSSSTNVGALNSATTAQSAMSLAQRLAQQGVTARAGHLLSAMA